MDATKELLLLRERLESQLRVLQSEIDSINKAVKLLERERPSFERDKPEQAIKPKQFSSLGVTDAIRSILRGEFVTPLQVRDQLLLGGFPHSGKSKLLNIVWATMKRLGQGDGYEIGTANGGKFAVRRKAAPRDPAMLPLGESGKALQ